MFKNKETLEASKSVIEDFQLHEQVGIGNFGRVIRAFNSRREREVALKILPKENIAQMKHSDHVVNERESLAHLTELCQMAEDEQDESVDNRSRFVIKFFSSFQDSRNLYLELEYVKGCTLLSQVHSRNHAVQARADFYAGEAILALEYLHREQIVYRDLKPENMMLSQKHGGHIKLVDFGFAKMLKGIGRTHTNCGTAQYIAPEVFLGESYDCKIDIWSLGVLICELVSGQTPFQAPTTKQLYEAIARGTPKFNKKVTVTVRKLLQMIFVTDQTNRPSLDEIKKHEFFRAVDFDQLTAGTLDAPWIPDDATITE